MFKRNLIIGLGTLGTSLFYVVIWSLIGILFGIEYSKGFLLFYALQFILVLTPYTLTKGACIYGNLKKDMRYAYTGYWMSFILNTIISVIFILLIPMFLAFNNVAEEFASEWTTLGIFYICLFASNTQITAISDILNYQQKEKTGSKLMWVTVIVQAIMLLAVGFISKSMEITCCFTASVSFVLLLLSTVKYIKFKFIWTNPIRFIRYRIPDAISELCRSVDYLSGVKTVRANPSIYTAVNISSYSTDCQWDMRSSVNTGASIDLASNKFNMRNHVKAGLKYSIVLLISSAILETIFCVVYAAFDVAYLAWEILIQYFGIAIHCCFLDIVKAYIAIKGKVPILVTIGLVGSVSRTILTIVLQFTPYCILISQGIIMLYNVIAYSIYFSYLYRKEKQSEQHEHEQHVQP